VKHLSTRLATFDLIRQILIVFIFCLFEAPPIETTEGLLVPREPSETGATGFQSRSPSPTPKLRTPALVSTGKTVNDRSGLRVAAQKYWLLFYCRSMYCFYIKVGSSCSCTKVLAIVLLSFYVLFLHKGRVFV